MTGKRQARRLVLVVILTVMGLLAFGSAAGASESAESAFVSKLNAERAQRGLAALGIDGELTRVARDWSAQMVANGAISHRPNLRAVVADGRAALGENVGRSALTGASEAELVERIHRAFMDSPGHRQNVLGDWTHVGIGVRVTDGGSQMWVTVNFKAVPQPQPQPQPEPRPEPAREASAEAAGPAAAQAKAPQPDTAEVAAGSGDAQEADVAQQTAESDEAGEAAARLVSTARGALSPAVRAHFSLHNPRPLPRQLAGYLAAV